MTIPAAMPLPGTRPLPLAALTLGAAGLVAVGLLAIGVSGLLAALMGTLFGPAFVAGDLPGAAYTAARCADFLRFHPEAGSCLAVASAHHFDEIVESRVAAGVLGLIVLGGWLVARRSAGSLHNALPPVMIPTAGVAAFGVAGAGFTMLGALRALPDFGGGGEHLSAGIVALFVAAAYAVALLRALTR